jgi:hypothetical protein
MWFRLETPRSRVRFVPKTVTRQKNDSHNGGSDVTRTRDLRSKAWDQSRGRAHIPTCGRNGICGTRRASVDDPRLLASRKSQCDEQVLSDGIAYEAPRSAGTGEGDSALHLPPGEPAETVAPDCTQIPRVPSCMLLKGMAGTTGLEPAASAVTVLCRRKHPATTNERERLVAVVSVRVRPLFPPPRLIPNDTTRERPTWAGIGGLRHEPRHKIATAPFQGCSR